MPCCHFSNISRWARGDGIFMRPLADAANFAYSQRPPFLMEHSKYEASLFEQPFHGGIFRIPFRPPCIAFEYV